LHVHNLSGRESREELRVFASGEQQ
jgi:hypothetical protein